MPYSSAYSAASVFHGSLSFLRTGTNPAPKWYATGDARMNPRASMPDDLVDVAATEVHHDQVDHRGERDRVGEQRRDVLEDDALLREVGHVADQRLDLSSSIAITSACASPAASAGSSEPGRGLPWALRAVARVAAAAPTAAGSCGHHLSRRPPIRGTGRRRRSPGRALEPCAVLLVSRLALLQHRQERRGDEDRRVRTGDHADQHREGEVLQGVAAEQQQRQDRQHARRATCSPTASAPGSSRGSRPPRTCSSRASAGDSVFSLILS